MIDAAAFEASADTPQRFVERHLARVRDRGESSHLSALAHIRSAMKSARDVRGPLPDP